MDLGAAIRSLRETRGWSQEELAHRAGIGQPTFQRIESGVSTRPTVQNVVRIARALGVTVEHLMAESPEDPIASLERRVAALEVAIGESGGKRRPT